MDLETGMVAWSHYELLLPNRPPARIVVTLGDLQHESSVAQIARSSGATHFGLVSIANADGGMSQAIATRAISAAAAQMIRLSIVIPTQSRACH